MGATMSCLPLWTDFRRIGKCIASTICCMVCFGPILIIIGAVYLTLPDDRTEKVNFYKNAVEEYTSSQPLFEAASPLSITSQLTGASPSALSPSDQTTYGNGKSFSANVVNTLMSINDPPQSGENYPTQLTISSYVATPQPYPNSQSFDTQQSYDLLINGNSVFGGVGLQSIKPYRNIIRPSTCSCQTRRGVAGCVWGYYRDDGVRVESFSTILICEQAECASFYGDVSGDDCIIHKQLTSVCMKVAQSTTFPTQWQIVTGALGDGDFGGCSWQNDALPVSTVGVQDYVNDGLYPLTYANVPLSAAPFDMNSVTVTVRDSNDPMIAYSYITKGNDFGLTEAQKRAIGIGCVIAGCVWTVLLITCIYGIARFYRSKGPLQNTVVRTTEMQTTIVTGQPVQPMYQPAAYGQPIYGQAPPVYGQAPPVYGQAPPVYGQPAPPAYSQPGYAPPQTGYETDSLPQKTL